MKNDLTMSHQTNYDHSANRFGLDVGKQSFPEFSGSFCMGGEDCFHKLVGLSAWAENPHCPRSNVMGLVGRMDRRKLV